MTMSSIAEYPSGHFGSTSGPAVGRALVASLLAIVVLSTVAIAEVAGPLAIPLDTSSRIGSQFGMVAATTFAIAGLLASHRAIVHRNLWVGVVALVLLGPGAAWSWSTFAADATNGRLTSSLVLVAAGVLAAVLLAKGLRLAHWIEVFGGLSAAGLAIVATIVRIEPSAATATAPALLAAVTGMVCLYGLLVDLEMAEQRSLVELVESRKRIANEVAQVEDMLHDLRGGLLAIEAAIGSFDGELAGPLRAEAARLRRLTLTGARAVTDFDLVERVQNLVTARQAAGIPVSLHVEGEAMAWGEESEVLAIVDNLLSNAERHGEPGPIVVEIDGDDALTNISVRNRGQLPPGDPDEIFRRGVTTHPDGQGLGLARARMLADVNGAELRVEPAETGFTTFVLSLRSPAALAA